MHLYTGQQGIKICISIMQLLSKQIRRGDFSSWKKNVEICVWKFSNAFLAKAKHVQIRGYFITLDSQKVKKLDPNYLAEDETFRDRDRSAQGNTAKLELLGLGFTVPIRFQNTWFCPLAS